MISMMVQTKKYADLGKFADIELVKMSARITSLWGESLANYIRENELSGQVLQVVTGETRASMGFYKLKKDKKATMVVRPGKNIKGHLNYLGGMQRGMLAGRGRKVLIRPKPFMKPGFRAWRATGEPRRIKEEVFQAYLKKSFAQGSNV
jgi:hypothetical protein